MEQILKAHVVFFCLTDQLERVFLRLGHAETDDQLQDIISKFLPPVLLKLSSVQEGVRKKVMHRLMFGSMLCDKTEILYYLSVIHATTLAKLKFLLI